MSTELVELITTLLRGQRREAPFTLHDVRLALQQNDSARLEEGELSHPQDRTVLLIEIDELIDEHGVQMPAAALLPALPA